MTLRDRWDCDCPECAGRVWRLLAWLPRWRLDNFTAFLLGALGAALMAAWLYLE